MPAMNSPSKRPDLERLAEGDLKRLATEEQLVGNHELALSYFDEADRRRPGHPAILLGRLQCHHRLRQPDQVKALARQIQRLVAGQPAAIDHFGEELQKIREYDLALETFSAMRDFPQAPVRAVGLSREAALHLRVGRRQEAEAVLAKAEKLGAQLPEVQSVKALICRKKQPELARRILDKLSRPDPAVPPPFTATSAHSLAAVCDALKLPDEAMAALARGKEIEQSQPLVRRFRAQRPAWHRWHLDALDFDRPEAEAWAREAMDPSWPSHAFLLGHPRSGTTLLEQMLDAHPSICSVEESDVYSSVFDATLIRRHEEAGGTPPFAPWVRALPEPAINGLRERYFATLAMEAGKSLEGVTVLDKNPGLTVSVARLARTLPAARLIVMIRDPRDVCLSAYFQSTHRTPWSVNWLTLGETVEQYAFTMDLWLRTKPKLVQPWLEVRYEDVIRDPAGEGAKVTRFLGHDWHPAQADPAAHARTKVVRSPTHDDVAQPIHRRAIGRWQAYAKYLAPFQERLKPFVEAFGYGEEG